MILNRLLGDMLGTLRNSDPKLVELKVGQIVSGMVLKLLAEQEALVNIGGMTVHAKLEAPLRQGERTLLQVQPESKGDTIVLKPLNASQARIADASLGELLSSVRAKDTAANRELLQQLHAAGIPIDRNSFDKFSKISEARPGAVPGQQWMEAAIAADRKGLPLSPEIVSPLRQVLSGPSLSVLIREMDEALTQYLKGAADQTATNRSAAETAGKLLEAIRLVMLSAANSPAETAGARREVAAPMQPAVNPGNDPSTSPGSAQNRGNPASSTGGRGAPDADNLFGKPNPGIGDAGSQSAAKPAGDPASGGGRHSTAADPLPQVRSPHTTPSATQDEPGRDSAAARPHPQTNESDSRAANRDMWAGGRPGGGLPDTEVPGRNWLTHWMKQIGFDNEHRLAEQLLSPQGEAAADTAARPENVKALLLALLDGGDLPQALKDSAQQMLQHITGQQLLLGADRIAPIATVTLFVPVPQRGGSESDTATVHIQSRRNKSGGLDPENCRLLFDLRMQTMGDTLIDVQVVDRIVSLQIYNDHAAAGQLLAVAKPEIQSALSAIGYQCISLKLSPYPAVGLAGRHADASASGEPAAAAAVAGLHASKPYKGVDIRV